MALATYAAALLIALIVVPWDGGVAPWADLQGSMLSAFTAEEIATIEEYVASAWLPGFLGLVAGPLAAVTIALIPAARRRLAAIVSSRHPDQPLRSAVDDLIVAAAILAIVRLAVLPFALWSAQVRRDAGLLIEPWSTWWLRWLGESVAYIVVGALALTLALLILRRWPQRGWITVAAGAGLAAIAVTAGLPFLQRVEGTTADPQLTARVQSVADRAGVDVGAVTVIAVADSTPAINANVSGWGPTRTVTVYDTATATLSDAELDALIAHELIHVREGDAVLGASLAVFAAIGTAALVSALLLSARVRRWLGASSPGDARLVPLAVATFLVASFVATAVGATISRPLESRADREAIAMTGDAAAYRSLIRQLAVTNRSTLTPTQWRYALVFTHPTPLQRMAASSG